MKQKDYTQRFLFEHTNVRGEHVFLSNSFTDALKQHDYPFCVKKLLGKMSAVAVLLSSTLKHSAVFTLQARSQGPVTLLMAECTHQRYFRTLARFNEKTLLPDDATLETLLPKGQLLVSVDTEKRKRYQSVVTLDQPTLEKCFVAYFRQSEQLPTKLWLASDDKQAAGFLLQSLPTPENITNTNTKYKKIIDWDHIITLAETIQEKELLSLDTQTLLSRLYHEDDIRLFDKHSVDYKCTCSKERIARSLLVLGKEALKDILRERGHVETNCQFCNQQYHYSEQEVLQLIRNLN